MATISANYLPGKSCLVPRELECESSKIIVSMSPATSYIETNQREG